MYIDRETVLSLLDKSKSNYDDIVLSIMLLPKDALFEVVSEDTVTAEYFDETKQKLFSIELEYEYLDKETYKYEYEKRELADDINSSLIIERNTIGFDDKYFIIKTVLISLVVIIFIVCIILVITLGGMLWV